MRRNKSVRVLGCLSKKPLTLYVPEHLHSDNVLKKGFSIIFRSSLPQRKCMTSCSAEFSSLFTWKACPCRLYFGSQAVEKGKKCHTNRQTLPQPPIKKPSLHIRKRRMDAAFLATSLRLSDFAVFSIGKSTNFESSLWCFLKFKPRTL